MGTPAYMSPEQCNDTGKLDQRTDIYSLGCVLFHLLTGRVPFDADGVGAMIAAHLKEPATPPSAVAPHVPTIIDPLVIRCLAKHPEGRFTTMLELQRACDAVLEQLPAEDAVTAPRSMPSFPAREDATTTLGASVGESTASARPRRVTLWLGVSVAAVVAGVVLAVMTTGGSSGSEPSTISPTARPGDKPSPNGPATPGDKPSPNVPAMTGENAAAPVAPATVEPARTELTETEPAKTAPVTSGEAAPKQPAKKPPRKPAPKKPQTPAGVYDEWD